MNVTLGKTADLTTILCLVFLKKIRAETLKQRIGQSIQDSDHTSDNIKGSSTILC